MVARTRPPSVARGVVFCAGVLCAFAYIDAAQQTKIEKITVKSTSPASGKQMYQEYCAVCHGKDGKGNGPAASTLKVAPPNLTLLAKNNGGKFPQAHVSTVLRSGSTITAHGSREMPIWDPLFQSISEQEDALVAQRIANLTHYLETLQAK
jgi:mono/diheme cytochrome c family protein